MEFSHASLNRASSEIRLVRLVEPNKTDLGNLAAQPIRLQIFHTSLNNENTKYVALSYAWGEPSQHDASEVTINGERLVIGGNLYACLAQLRQNCVRSWIWVDSICIKQSDYEEKTWQVAQMGAIFSKADLVYTWLGRASHETDLAMEFLSRIGPRAVALGCLDGYSNYRIRDQVNDFVLLLVSDFYRQMPIKNDGLSTDIKAMQLACFALDLLKEPNMNATSIEKASLVSGINIVFQKEYWQRIWVIQEVALAKDAVILCGTKSVQIDSFHAAVKLLQFVRTLKHFKTRYKQFGKGLTARFGSNTALDTRRDYRNHKTPITLASIVVPVGPPPPRCPFYCSSDPRDIVFGVVGILSQQESLGMRVNYEMTTSQVFTALTRALIDDGEKRFIPNHSVPPYELGRCVPRVKSENYCDIDLPTWVPDWREIGKRGFLGTFGVSHVSNCHASQGMAAIPNALCIDDEDEQLGRLRKYGCHVDVVSQVMPSPHWILNEDGEWSRPRLADPTLYIAKVLEFANIGPESSAKEDSLWRTITLDRETMEWLDSNPSSPGLSEDILCLIRKMARRDSIQVDLLTAEQKRYILNYADVHNFGVNDENTCPFEMVCHSVVKHWQEQNIESGVNIGHTLFKTTKGMLGLGCSVVRRGDIVTLLSSVRSPIILRPRDDQSGEGFYFMGDAYVDGIMQGEFLQTSPVYETFDIY